ncbi:MAG: HlyC/CorC family transporter [Calditrichaeota bacterium]|nr:HlyC/CorC family transporter [Calditrichota bacterium]
MDPHSSSFPLLTILFPVLIFLSAFFSGSETAFFSLSKSTLALLKNDERSSSKRILKLLEKPQIFLITILIYNNLVNIIIAAQATLITQELSVANNWNIYISMIVNVGVVTFIILFFGEIFPKIVALKDSLWFARKVSIILTIFTYLMYPVALLFKQFTGLFSASVKDKLNQAGFTEEEIKTLLDISEEAGTIENNEKEMISSIMDFGETTVKEIMVPRIDMSAIRSDAPIQELFQLVNESLHSRIPVYKDGIDNVIGIIYVRDLIKHVFEDGSVKDTSLEKLAHKAYFVPEQKKIQDLLKEFQAEKIHMAIVVDEYGGTSGIVTLEDIIEEIVGEIQDEYDLEQPLLNKINDYNYIIDGKLPIEELNENLNLNIPEEEGVETISGFIYNKTGNLPEKNDVIEHDNLTFKIKDIENRRIARIELIINKSSE